MDQHPHTAHVSGATAYLVANFDGLRPGGMGSYKEYKPL